MTHRSSPAFSIGGIAPDSICVVCGCEVNGHHFLEVRGYCSEHCPDHDFEYDPYERGRFCVHCGMEHEYEPDEHDVPISFIDGDRPLGTPLSQLSGRPGHPGYAEFCRIAESWGYE